MKKNYKRLLLYTPIFILLLYVLFLVAHNPDILPQKWVSQKSNGYVEAFAANNSLDKLEYLDISPYTNSETIIFNDGWLYCSVDNGIIIRLKENGSDISEVVHTGGAIVGFAFDKDNNIVFADAAYDEHGGAICIAYKDNNYEVEVLVNEYNGERLMFPDAITINSEDEIFFTDACKVSPAFHSKSTNYASNIDHIAHTKTGNLYVYSPDTKETQHIAGGFSFANGIALSQDEKSIFLIETSEYRIWSIDCDIRNATAGDAGTKVLIDNLPGFPDNLFVGEGENIWVGLVSPRSDLMDSMNNNTFVRKLLLNLSNKQRSSIMAGVPYTHFFSFNESSEILMDYQSDNLEYTNVTGIWETSDKLFIQSLCGASKIAYILKSDL